MRPALRALALPIEPEQWSALGLGDTAGDVALQPGATALAWSVDGVGETDGLPTVDAAPATAAATELLAVDHVVVMTPQLERTVGALSAAGLDARRTEQAGELRRSFLLMANALAEVVESPEVPEGPASFWGVTFVVADVDAIADRLGKLAGTPRDAVQPGRRIVTLRTALPVALITPRRA